MPAHIPFEIMAMFYPDSGSAVEIIAINSSPLRMDPGGLIEASFDIATDVLLTCGEMGRLQLRFPDDSTMDLPGYIKKTLCMAIQERPIECESVFVTTGKPVFSSASAARATRFKQLEPSQPTKIDMDALKALLQGAGSDGGVMFTAEGGFRNIPSEN